METQFKFITDLARRYKIFNDNPNELYKALNELPEQVLEEIYKEYGDPESRIQPVNLLRAECARRMLDGAELNEVLVEEIKEKIRTKDLDYFKHLPPHSLDELSKYSIGKRDIFGNWQKPWSIFHTFFYRTKWGNDKEQVQNYLEQIAKDLIKQLGLTDYKYHTVDFQGPSNFGMDFCWIALYPITKNTHQDAYQFFLRLGAEPEAGRVAGFSLKDKKDNILTKVESYDEVVKVLLSQKNEIIRLNQGLRNYFKFSPGSQAAEWNTFYQQGIAALYFSDYPLEDISEVSSREQLNEMAGLDKNSQSNQTWNLWLLKTANIGDVVFANKGVNTCIGIGIIEGNYYYDHQAQTYQHKRKINWITDKVYQYNGNALPGYKTLFRPDTFSPTKVWEFLLREYIRNYPELIDVFRSYKLDVDSVPGPLGIPVSSGEAIEEGILPISFWWLNANPRIWSINTHSEGELQTYTTYNEKGNKRRIYKYFEEVKPGDLMVGYESTPTKQIKAIYEITKGIHQSDEGEAIEFQLVEKLEVPVHWNELKNIAALEDCEVFINHQGSLFRLTEEEYDIIREIIDNKNIIKEKQIQEASVNPYSFISDPDKPFISEAAFKQCITVLKRKKNMILQGPPGVGKTFIARKIAYEIMGEINDAQIEMVQFHQSYSYEDFVQGIRPNSKGAFDIRNGIFYSFCTTAISHPNKEFFFIIDEVNRGNLSKIFGELMMLMETDKRGEKYAIKLTYAEDEEDRFYVPENLYIIGTMNTADRSLSIVDYALRRRFSFINLQPEYGPEFRDFLSSRGLSEDMVGHIVSSITKLNDRIIEDINLGNGYQIGHSFFCSYTNRYNEIDWWNDIIEFELKPLLEELWFDDTGKVVDMIKLLRR